MFLINPPLRSSLASFASRPVKTVYLFRDPLVRSEQWVDRKVFQGQETTESRQYFSLETVQLIILTRRAFYSQLRLRVGTNSAVFVSAKHRVFGLLCTFFYADIFLISALCCAEAFCHRPAETGGREAQVCSLSVGSTQGAPECRRGKLQPLL